MKRITKKMLQYYKSQNRYYFRIHTGKHYIDGMEIKIK